MPSCLWQKAACLHSPPYPRSEAQGTRNFRVLPLTLLLEHSRSKYVFQLPPGPVPILPDALHCPLGKGRPAPSKAFYPLPLGKSGSDLSTGIRKGKRRGHRARLLPGDRQMAPSITGRGWVAKVDVRPLGQHLEDYLLLGCCRIPFFKTEL